MSEIIAQKKQQLLIRYLSGLKIHKIYDASINDTVRSL